MEKGKNILLKILIVLVTFICADNGRAFMFAGNSIQIVLSHHHDKNAEESHHNHFSGVNDNEKWLQTENLKMLSDSFTLLPSLFYSKNPSGEFSDSVW